MPDRFEVSVEREVAVAMPDGVLLFTDVYHPVRAGDCPTIVTRCPYGRALFTPAARAYAERGYHVVLQDCRGTAPSKGEPSVFAEAPDGRATGDWIARQPWFDGRLGADGGSYLGFTALAFASTRPPYLKALSLQVFGADRAAAWFPGGSFALDLALSWSQIRVATRDGGLDMSDLPKLAASMKDMAVKLERGFAHLPLGEADRIASGETLPGSRTGSRTRTRGIRSGRRSTTASCCPRSACRRCSWTAGTTIRCRTCSRTTGASAQPACRRAS